MNNLNQQDQSQPNQLISSHQGNKSLGINLSEMINLAYSTLSDKKKIELTQDELDHRLTMVQI